jgi:hypothetical protein
MPVAAILALALSLLLGCGAAGCVSIGRQYEGAVLPAEKLAAVKVGTTAKTDILARFGPPTTIQRRDLEGLIEGVASRFQGSELTVKLDPAVLDDVYIYEYRRVNRLLLFFGFFNYVKSVDKSDRLIFFFDQKGRVLGFGLTEGTKEL